MNKQALRKIYTAKREALALSQAEAGSKAIAEHFITSSIWKDSLVIHIFLSIPGKVEVDTSYLINFFQKKHPEIKLCTSIIAENGADLLHTYIKPDTIYASNKWNIPEPVTIDLLSEREIDLVIIPLLAFDRKGNRVGYGKGFYDRFLNKCKADVRKIGLSLFEPTAGLIDADTWDIPLTHGVSPTGIINCNN
jgi:5-formyltetrahydrofolate cyclo-ligase